MPPHPPRPGRPQHAAETKAGGAEQRLSKPLRTRCKVLVHVAYTGQVKSGKTRGMQQLRQEQQGSPGLRHGDEQPASQAESETPVQQTAIADGGDMSWQQCKQKRLGSDGQGPGKADER